jgi:hypothetical protein
MIDKIYNFLKKFKNIIWTAIPVLAFVIFSYQLYKYYTLNAIIINDFEVIIGQNSNEYNGHQYAEKLMETINNIKVKGQYYFTKESINSRLITNIKNDAVFPDEGINKYIQLFSTYFNKNNYIKCTLWRIDEGYKIYCTGLDKPIESLNKNLDDALEGISYKILEANNDVNLLAYQNLVRDNRAKDYGSIFLKKNTYPDKSLLFHLLGTADLIAGNFDFAYHSFNDAINEKSDSANLAATFNNLGLVYFEKSKIDSINKENFLIKSVDYFESALEIDKAYFKSYLNLYNSYINMKDFSNAKKIMEDAIIICPNQPEILSYYALLSENNGDTDLTNKYMTKALNLESNNVVVNAFNLFVELKRKPDLDLKLKKKKFKELYRLDYTKDKYFYNLFLKQVSNSQIISDLGQVVGQEFESFSDM